MKKLVPLALLLLLAVAAVVFLWPSPPAGPEAFHYGRDACDHCRMHISEKGFGGQIRSASGEVTRYDDIGCLLAALAVMPQGSATAWVEDRGGDGFVELSAATFVRGGSIKTPMGSGIVAYRSPDAARTAAAAAGADVLTSATLNAAPEPAAPSAEELFAPTADGKRPLTEVEAMAGKATYIRECSACHGERGDGEGPAAAFLDPRPRDLRKGTFKLRTTESGQPARTADIYRTVERGIPGSAMPAFTYLDAKERREVVAYVLYLADWIDAKEPAAVPRPKTIPETTPESIAAGKVVYKNMGCASCHGELGKGDGAQKLTDDKGRPIAVRDFTGGVFRGGGDRLDLYYRFVTGMDGTPMPSYGDTVPEADRFPLVDYVMSLKVEPAPVPYPTDPLLAGRQVADKFGCRGCHALDDGAGGDVGPDLRISGQKLASLWVRGFLNDPRAAGRLYPWRPHRMPGFVLDETEVEVMTRYLAAMGNRTDAPLVLPDVAAFPPAKLEEGKNFYLLRCGECHQLGKVIEVPAAKQQGPDLINVASRIDFLWVKKWVMDPKSVDPKSKMTVPEMTPEQVDSVLQFVWKHSMEASAR